LYAEALLLLSDSCHDLHADPAVFESTQKHTILFVHYAEFTIIPFGTIDFITFLCYNVDVSTNKY
jgi:hypothetical protein